MAWHPPPPVPLSGQDPWGCSRWRNRRQSTGDARFSICCQLCPPVHNKKFPLSVGAPAWLSLPRPSLRGESNSPRSCFSIWQRSPFARGCLAQAAAGVCHPWVQAGCARPGQPQRELCVRQLLCWLLGSFLIFTSTPDTRLVCCFAPSVLRLLACSTCSRLTAGHGWPWHTALRRGKPVPPESGWC